MTIIIDMNCVDIQNQINTSIKKPSEYSGLIGTWGISGENTPLLLGNTVPDAEKENFYNYLLKTQNEIDNDLSTIVKFHMDCQNKGSEMRNNLATRPLNDQLKEEASLSYIPLAYYSFSTIYLIYLIFFSK